MDAVDACVLTTPPILIENTNSNELNENNDNIDDNNNDNDENDVDLPNADDDNIDVAMLSLLAQEVILNNIFSF